MKEKWLADIELVGNLVTLLPLEHSHKEALLEAAADGRLWGLWYTSVPSVDTIDAYLDKVLLEKEQGIALPFCVTSRSEGGKVIGCTRFCKADPPNKRLEIGFTWYAKSYQRTGVNTECKYLMLQHAFEVLDVIAVQFMTHWFNFPSRKAILRLGAKQDGVLRNHRIEPDGHIRDTAVYSIIREEWQTVKRSLEFEMSKYQE